MNLIDFLNSPTAHALGWTLLHAVWQGFALVLPTAVMLHLLRNRSGALRYRLSVLTLLTQLLVSVATFAWYYVPVTAVSSQLSPAPLQTASVQWPIIAQTLVRQPLPWQWQMRQFLENHLSQFVLIYLVGVAIFGVRLAGGWLYLNRLSKTAVQPAEPYWAELTNRLRLALTIRSIVQVRESVRIAVPMVVGVLKPVLLLPFGLAAQLSVQELEAVLAHELAHVKRHDYAVNLLQSVVEVLYFFHPALWWLSARVREEREHCCDDLAVQACGGNGRTLAQALARVEELRLTQAEPTPALAMAFATQRQQLLHRVRRVLGVPTRPLVSNGSLAGLTLATILLMSVSVYAVQQQDKPKPRATKPQPTPTRRHKVDKDTEFGFSANRKVDYVIWKGQKLSVSRVALLQRQFDQVMAGQLNLDAVKQPNRDILLTIIETNNSFSEGMNGLAQGLAQIDYNTIIKTGFDAANAAGTFPVNVDEVLKEVEKIDYNSLIGDAMAVIDTNISGQLNNRVIQGDVLMPPTAAIAQSPEGQYVYHYDNADRVRYQRQMDSLSRLMDQHAQQMQRIHLQMEKFQFPIDELKRSQDVLNWRKDKLMGQRNALIEKHQRLMQNDSKQKLNQAEVERQLEALQPEIKKLEGSMEELNKQFEAVTAKEDEIKLPMEKLQQEAERLQEEASKYASQMDKYGHDIDHSLRLNENLNINLNSELNRIELEGVRANARAIRAARPARAPRPLKPPYNVIEGNIVRPTTPTTPNRLNGRVSPVVPARASTPRPAVKPTPAPKPDNK